MTVERKRKPHFHVAAGLIWLDGRVLITKRPKGTHLEGLWEFPGGKQNKGELLHECLEREIVEELGIKIHAEKRLFTVDHEYEDRYISLHLFHCSRLTGKPEPLEDQEILWVHPDQLKNFDFPPPDYRFIQLLQETACFES
ncbi:MAG: (deoxy)nucleoside triphosphate pyrophosphohydrolase [Thermodesulfobacteriota bacterium]|nr:(deoxy)nucleoside triphosphate pyrophosphohydrolase [Thermodesulfobacteriota bacterium]